MHKGVLCAFLTFMSNANSNNILEGNLLEIVSDPSLSG